jgi:uncharacterized protein YraI
MRSAPFIFLGMLVLPLVTLQTAHAADGRLSDAVQMYAGPGTEFPNVRRLAKGLSVDVHGCLKTWEWCDVSWRGNRGWVQGGAVAFRRGDEQLPVSRFGQELGIPQVTFQVNSYWDTHYRGALWYADRSTMLRQSASYRINE